MADPKQRESGQYVDPPNGIQNYVGGEWVDPAGTETRSLVDPATGTERAVLALSTDADVDAAVSAARDAYPDWRQTSPVERVQPLFELKRRLEARQEEFAHTIVGEHGKTLDEARGELRRGIENVEVATGVPSLLKSGSGTVENVAADIDETAVRQPLGTFTVVTPFNFPVMIPLWFLPYAIATGNTVVLKPSEQVPETAQLLFEVFDSLDLPDGVVNLVHGEAPTVDALLTHENVTGVSFVGSTPVAKHVYETAAATGKRVQAQGGAKNHIVVTDSAEIDAAVPNIVGSAYGNAGQRCLANDLVVAVGNVVEPLQNRLRTAVEDLTLGRGDDEGVDVGPLVEPAAVESVREKITSAIDEGASPVVDRREFTHPDYPDGNFLGPMLLSDVTRDMAIAEEEIFGPVLGIMSVDDLDAAIEVVNNSSYGNAASIFTERGGEAKQFRHRAEAGNIGVNVGVCGPMAFFHFGGRGDSFFGDLHAQGEDAIRFYTDETVVIERWYS